MEAVDLLLYIGAVWLCGTIGLFSWNLFTSGHEHADRLALLPVEDNWSDPTLAREPRPKAHERSDLP